MTNITTIEDCLELVAGLKLGPKIQIESSDVTIMHSIARQVFKGTALTDRQFALMKQKLTTYKDQFLNIDCDFDYVIEQLRQPLREIDRSKYIKIADKEDEIPLAGIDENSQWIKVRFPFKKSLIMLINDIASAENYYHRKGSHEHFYALNDLNIDLILGKFVDKGFEIDQELLDRYDDIQTIKQNKTDYIPYFDGEKIHNLNASAIHFLKKEIEEISKDNFIKVVDRSLRYGYRVDKKECVSITEKIAYRKSTAVHIPPSKHNLQETLMALYTLDRFPLVVLLDEAQALDQLDSVYKIFRDVVPSSQQAVMFRKTGYDDFNVYVKDKSLNNWVDNSTKIVYINAKKVPKVLLSSGWNPITALCFDSFNSREIEAYVGFNTDLFIAYEEHLSPFARNNRSSSYIRRYGI